MNRLKTILFATVLAPALALAQISTPPSSAPLTGTHLTITITANGVTTPYVVDIDGASLRDFSWQLSQYLQNAQGQQWQTQFAIPMCLVTPPVVQPVAPAIGTNLDATTSRLLSHGEFVRFDPGSGAVYRAAERLGGAVVQKLCVYGDTIYGKAKTGTQSWFRWDEKSGWGPLPGQLDTTVLN